MFDIIALYLLDNLRSIIGSIFILISLVMLYVVLKAKKKLKTTSPDLRFADPSHDPKNKSQKLSVLSHDLKITAMAEANKEKPFEAILTEDDVKKYVTKNLLEKGVAGAPYQQVRNYCWVCISEHKSSKIPPKDFN